MVSWVTVRVLTLTLTLTVTLILTLTLTLTVILTLTLTLTVTLTLNRQTGTEIDRSMWIKVIYTGAKKIAAGNEHTMVRVRVKG